MKKGNRLFVAGSLAQNTFETEDGQRRHRTEVHAQEVVFLDSNGNGDGESRERKRGEGSGSAPAASAASAPTPF